MLKLKSYEKETRVCRFCDKGIKNYRTYCSFECRIKYGIKLRTYKCDNCNIIFTIEKGPNKHKKRSRKLRFCSNKCFGAYFSGERNYSWKGVKEERRCLTCNNLFLIRNTKQKNKFYCNKICRKNRDRKGEIYVKAKCLECNNIFETFKRTNINKFCGFNCRELYRSKRMLDKNNPNYVHGEANIRYPVEWNKRFKEKIRLRDEYRCQLCDLDEVNHGKKLCVHHIDFDRFNLSPENLITLCKYCHGKFHGKYTREKCKEELLNLLKEKKKHLSMSII
jgi:hypothetical protein